jgi:hypothetical protein
LFFVAAQPSGYPPELFDRRLETKVPRLPEAALWACFVGEWVEAKSMVEGMLAEPWVVRAY